MIDVMRDNGHAGRVPPPTPPTANHGHAGRVTLPERKRLDHRGPLSLDVAGAWYFITLCADGHRPWVGSRVPRDRSAERMPMDFHEIANAILSAARWYHEHGKWMLAAFLVMPDHLHFIAHFPVAEGGVGHAGRVTLPMVAVIQQFKSYLARTYGIEFQRGFFDTRIRDDAHFDEKFQYVRGNPVRKDLCATADDWPYFMAFNRDGQERSRGTRDHTECDDVRSRGTRDHTECDDVRSRGTHDPTECGDVRSRGTHDPTECGDVRSRGTHDPTADVVVGARVPRARPLDLMKEDKE